MVYYLWFLAHILVVVGLASSSNMYVIALQRGEVSFGGKD